ncbi:MAG: DUF1549 domain-containing protein, partial [Planctomycetales bacterium]|nr:DUF1549 domain-containing protein [Planctomycetales bacterium]
MNRLILTATVIVQLCVARANAESIRFSRDVRSILSDKCFKCHGPDAESREADLRLDNREDAEHVLDSSDSELLRRIVSDDPDEVMPPPGSKITLTDREREILTKWIASGAEYEGHWSFQRIGKPDVPDVVANVPGWSIPVQGAPAMNDIDRFVVANLNSHGLSPQPQTSREQLARRLYFDLTGLPPTIDDIDAFLNDDSADAYERLVDRLLASKSFGERLASDWLDAARYSDTYGYQVDRDRFVWPWRDWLINAINDNLPYDDFITWQLAGDLLPDATDNQILATTFNRLHPQKVEGGSTPEEFRVEYVADRNHTFGTAFLGLTLECCRCHEHKYDPITQTEYYQLFAFFNNIDEAGLYSYFTSSIPTPTQLLTTESQQADIASKRKAIQDAEENVKSVADKQLDAFVEWLSTTPTAPETLPGQIAHLNFEGGNGANKTVQGKVGSAAELTGDDAIGLKVGNFRRSQPFSVSLWINSPDHKERATIFHRSRAWTDAGSRGYQLLMEDGKLSFSLIHFWPGNAIRVSTKHQVAINEWTQVTVTYDGSSKASGVRLYLNGELADSEVIRDNLYKNITGGGGDNIAIGERFRDRGFSKGKVDEFRVFDRQLTDVEVKNLFAPEHLSNRLHAAAEVPKSESADALRQQAEDVYAYFLCSNEEYKQALATLREAHQS